MTVWVLILTHSACTFTGALLGRWFVLRTIRTIIVREDTPMTNRDLHPPRSFWLGVVILVSSLLVIGIGIQAHLASEDNKHRDHTDRTYAACLTRFANDLGAGFNRLIGVLDKRSHAVAKLDRARTHRENAVDHIIDVIIATRTNPPTAGEQDFTDSLTAFEKARRRLTHVQKSVATTRRQNPIDAFKPPEATCHH